MEKCTQCNCDCDCDHKDGGKCSKCGCDGKK